MRKVELCTASTGITNCDGAVVVGSGDKVVDIASVGAAAAAANYRSPELSKGTQKGGPPGAQNPGNRRNRLSHPIS